MPAERRAIQLSEEAVGRWDHGDLAGAERLFREAMRICPTYGRACSSLGMVMLEQNRYEEGIAFLRQAVTVDPAYAGARVNLGIALYFIDETGESILQYQEALRLEPDNSKARFNLLVPLLNTCDWDAVDAQVRWLLSNWRDGHGVKVLDCISPFVSLLVPLPQEFRLQVARHHSAQAAARVASLPGLRRPAARRGDRLRVGYVSNMFRNHATTHLASGMFEAHDRGRFECFAYSYSIDDGSEYRRRSVAAFEHFVEIGGLSHHAAAQRIADDAIDILVDLNGYTEGSRLEILALRPAPVQVHFLGFPGTMGADFIDYLVADRTVIPESDVHHYCEQVAWMPATYQINDRGQRIAQSPMERAEAGLPDRFVFCCFNNHAKIERQTLDAWLRVLAAAPGSVLWLLAGPGEPALRARAQQQGIDPVRLIFSRVAPKAEHLARLRFADLMLDTLTYNGHTTASDALWAGVPVLTCPSPGYAGHVAASLLRAAGLPELIAADLAAYERQAIGFARDPASLRALARRLADDRLKVPLFDTLQFTRDLERAYETMWARHAAGEPPLRFLVR